MMNRECNKCIHHTSGMCDSWDCKMQTVEDLKKEAREKGIDDFAKLLHEICGMEKGDEKYPDMLYLHRTKIDEIAMELKGE